LGTAAATDRDGEAAIETAPSSTRNAPATRACVVVRVRAPGVVRIPSDVSPAVAVRETAPTSVSAAVRLRVCVADSDTAPKVVRSAALVRVALAGRETAAANV